MGGARWQLGTIKHCGVDVGHWDVTPMGWEMEAQRPLVCCAGIGRRWMGVGHGGLWWVWDPGHCAHEMGGGNSWALCP